MKPLCDEKRGKKMRFPADFDQNDKKFQKFCIFYLKKTLFFHRTGYLTSNGRMMSLDIGRIHI